MPGARASLFAREGAKPMPSWSAWQTGLTTGVAAVANGGTTNLVFSTGIAVQAGDLVVIKASSGTPMLYASSLTYTGAGGGSGTRTSVYFAATSYCPATFFIIVPTASGTIIPTITYTASAATNSNQTVWAIAERWSNGRYDPAAAIASASIASGNAASTTITPINPNSAITWLAADYTATNPGGTIGTTGGGTILTTYQSNSIIGAVSGWQPARDTAAQTFGVTDTVAQKNFLAAMEIKPIAA